MHRAAAQIPQAHNRRRYQQRAIRRPLPQRRRRANLGRRRAHPETEPAPQILAEPRKLRRLLSVRILYRSHIPPISISDILQIRPKPICAVPRALLILSRNRPSVHSRAFALLRSVYLYRCNIAAKRCGAIALLRFLRLCVKPDVDPWGDEPRLSVDIAQLDDACRSGRTARRMPPNHSKPRSSQTSLTHPNLNTRYRLRHRTSAHIIACIGTTRTRRL